MKRLINKVKELGIKSYTAFTNPSKEQVQSLLFVTGIALLSLGLAKAGYAQTDFDSGDVNDERIAFAVEKIFKYLEGSFGVLVMVCAGLGAILSSAFGQYRAALGCLVVAVGAFILRAFVMTFFDTSNIEGLN
jgi:hypothetical protein